MLVLNVSDEEPSWNWLARAMAHRTDLRWRHASSRAVALPGWWPRHELLERALNAWRSIGTAADDTLVVSHGHSSALHAAHALALRRRRLPQLAYAFTFEELPQGFRRRQFARALRHVQRFVSFSTVEAQRYPLHFDLDPARFEAQLWAVQPPTFDLSRPPVVDGPYLSSIGSQGRDFTLLVDAVRAMPTVQLVIVAAPTCRGLERLPANVRLVNGIPLAQAMGILQRSVAMLVPLRDAEVACGHGSLVAAMHLGKAVAVTDSTGIHDYVQHDRTGLRVPDGDARAWRDAIDILVEDHARVARLGAAGQAFAREHCTQDQAVAWFERWLATRP